MILPGVPRFELTGRRALVTGGGRGIGLGCAVALAAHGAHVTLVARTEDETGAAAEAMRGEGWRAEALALDITDTAAVREALAVRPAHDILVNNAGAAAQKPLLDETEADFDRVFGLNVRALYFLTQAVAARLVTEGLPGSIVNISSQMGRVGGPDRTTYAASKHAVEGMTKAMAIELAPHGIRINTVGPTFVKTVLNAPYFEKPGFADWVLARIPMGRVAEVEDISGAVVFLCSPAAAMVTGSSLMVDGGWTAQ